MGSRARETRSLVRIATWAFCTATAILTSATPIAAQEPPGVWFLTAGDEVRFAVGGTAEVPPRSPREELLGWEWTDTAFPRRYPGPEAARYRPSGAGLRPWRDDGRRLGVPRLGIGPGRELLLLGDDEPSTAAATRWAEMLDGVEAAYRHSSPDLTAAERHGVIEVGRVGSCRLRSVPVGGDAPGWSGLTHEGAGRSVEIQRFLRLVDGPGDCGGRRLELAMIPAPRADASPDPYLVTWSELELRSLGFLDLEPTPRTPSVRTLAREPESAREQIHVAAWPTPTAGGADLCRAPFMRTLCLKDLRIREQLATAAVTDPAVAALLTDGCRAFFDRLPEVPSPHPCSDPSVWRRSVGVYRTGYTGEMPLREQPRLISRVSDAGEVQWLWSSAAGDGDPVRFPLADGTEVALAMPRTAPPGLAPEPPQMRPAAPVEAEPTPALARPQPATTTPTAAPAQASPAAIGPVAVNPPIDLDTDSTPPIPETAGPPILRVLAPPAAGRSRNAGSPADGRAASPLPRATELPEAATPATTTTAAPPGGMETVPGEPATGDGAARQPPAEPPASAALAAPLAASDHLLWPLALAALMMTLTALLLLRGQRTLARSRRRSLESGVATEKPSPVDLRLDAERIMDVEDVEDAEDAVDAVDVEAPAPIALLLPPELTAVPDPEPPPTPTIVPLEPPELTAATPEPRAAPSPLAEEWGSLTGEDRRGIETTLAATDRLGRWVDCLLPVLDDLEHGRGKLPGADRLPAPARREWRRSVAALRELADRDLGALRQLRALLDGSLAAPAPDEGPSAETRHLEDAGLLDPDRGTLRERLRRHLLAPGNGRLQQAVLALQYLVEAFPVEHLEGRERKIYRSTLRRRLRDAGLSTRFHRLASEVAAGLGRQYRQARYYKARLDRPDGELLRQAQDPISLSERVGYPAGTDAGTVVRLSELFLLDPTSGARTSGLAHVDGA